ncbi:hypothetical protein FHR75_003175 [Kineococcus radiotolerans]|uniref:Uncharacterized protein n=1 Tax=Kineococcus radiotolerans TaxID=131568 RepID=A0A7W4XYJ8_KINRA|nr:hypothetical protein [Kineococcus radiotolerans]MBB2902344.1 hypothetical protein [Kineococcus radiotolerans]
MLLGAGGGARPADWQPLAGEDPVPGRSADLGDVARRWRGVAEELERQAGEVRRLARGTDAAGRTVEALGEGAGDLATRLTGAVGRYRATAGALDDYVPHLQDAQRRSLDALHAARDAQARHDAAAAVLAANSTPAPAPAPVPGDPAATATAAHAHAGREADRAARAGAARRDAGAASADLAAARAHLAAAVADRDAAAERAARAIAAACAGDPLRDSRFDRFQQWVHENARWIEKASDWASTIGAIVALAALAVGWIPVVGQALAAALGIVALLATGFALVGHTLLALSGDGSWTAVAVDVVGLATFGIGKLAAPAAKAAAAALGEADTAVLATRAAQAALRARAGVEGVADVAARGLDPAATALSMASGGMRGATRAATRDALGTSGNAVDRIRAATRAAWRSEDTHGAAATAFADARAALAKPFTEFPDVLGGARAMKDEARGVFDGQKWKDAYTAVKAMPPGDVGSAVTRGLTDAVAQARTLTGVADAAKVVGTTTAAKMAAAVAADAYTSYEGIAQPLNELHLPHVWLPTAQSTSQAVLEKVAGERR